ncbi:alpha/beta hydrolase [Halosegnis sp.]|uniref:alpha/beta hydrolase n=1 Tax=Halosegnis sp. TaxID=2864959 RepID=UPI0035D48E05
MRADEPHPDVQDILARVEAADVMPLARYEDADTAREVAARMRADADGPSLEAVEDRTVPGPADDVPVRVYRPTEGLTPTVCYFHGGGWVIGNLESHDLACKHLAAKSGCTVVAVDYRRAPEHPYPAALEDCYAVTEWVAANPELVGGDGQLAVAGDSAGGNLAASVCLRARDEDGPMVNYQALVYPSVSPSDDWDSRRENGEGYYLTEPDMEWFGSCYFGDHADETDAYAFPLVADSHANLPPATVVTAGFDPIRDEGIAYADALREAGVSVTHHHYPAMIHAFFTMLAEPADLEAGHDAVAQVAADLRAALRAD